MTRTQLAGSFVALFVATALIVTAADKEPEKIQAKHQEAIAKGLQYLASQQKADGHWEATEGQYPVSMTALSGIALLMEGSTLEKGKYKDNLRKGVDWLMDQCQANGLVKPPKVDAVEHRYMFGHGYSLLFLSSVYGQEKDGERRKKLEGILKRAVKFSGEAQTKNGGWGYLSAADGGGFNEGAATVAQIQGLRAARLAGIEVPKELLERASRYVKLSVTKEGGMIYSLSMPSDKGRPALTAAALACNLSAQEYDSLLGMKMILFCQKNIPQRPAKGLDETFTYYYYSQVLYALGDEGYGKLFPASKPEDRLTWSKSRQTVFDHLVTQQQKDGSWPPEPKDIGSIYSTACILTIMQLDKGNVPIYQGRVEQARKPEAAP